MSGERPNDGGPAFPMPIASYNATGQPNQDSVAYAAEVYPGGQGMSLRDWFAGQALAGLLAQGARRAETCRPAEREWYASTSYFIADAMLAQREKEATA